VLRSGNSAVEAKLCLERPIWPRLPKKGVTQWWGRPAHYHRFPPSSPGPSLLSNSCPALPTADISSHALLLVCIMLSEQELSFWLQHPPLYLVLTHCLSMPYIQQALLSSAYGSTLQEDPGSIHDACGSLKLSFLPFSLVIHPASFLFPNSSNRSAYQGYLTPRPNQCFSMPSLHLSNTALLLPCPLLSLCYRTCMYACS